MSALEKLAKSYQNGDFGKKDPTRACYWWEQLAFLDQAIGQEQLGICFLRGKGREKDLKLGYAYLSLAQKNSSSVAEYILETYAERFSEAAKQEKLQLADQIYPKRLRFRC
ncbi:MAG: SEL1-like repeat protein [Cellvibrionaceae bacterium]|nr:SEL1-like repeat protein [Cellvibrionaceae bacterium]